MKQSISKFEDNYKVVEVEEYDDSLSNNSDKMPKRKAAKSMPVIGNKSKYMKSNAKDLQKK